MIDDLIALCRTSDWDRLYWYTERDNTVARRLYDCYSATDDHVRYKVNFGAPAGSGKSA